MRSKYLVSAEDLEVGDYAFADGDLDPVEILWLGHIYARVQSTDNGYEWTLMRNRLTKITDSYSANPGEQDASLNDEHHPQEQNELESKS